MASIQSHPIWLQETTEKPAQIVEETGMNKSRHAVNDFKVECSQMCEPPTTVMVVQQILDL
jgi:hypothetical protein